MAKLVAFYSRADENYFGGAYRYIEVGNTEKAAKMIAAATDAELFKIEQTQPFTLSVPMRAAASPARSGEFSRPVRAPMSRADLPFTAAAWTARKRSGACQP